MDYQEKLRLAKKALDSGSYDKETIEYIFPELKESEDEKIRKSIIGFLKPIASLKDGKTVSNEDFDSVALLGWAGWLEKQGEKANPYSGISFKYNGHIWGMCARDNGIDILLDKQLFKHLENQGEQKSIDNLKWNELTWEDINNLESIMNQVNSEFRNGISQKAFGEEVLKRFRSTKEDECVDTCDADKVETKFKVGDWIVTPDNEVKQIEKVTFGNYWFTDETLYDIIDVDNRGHLWTIQDANNGDVLLSPSTPEGDKECPFIFKEIDKNGIVRFHAALLQSENIKIADGITNVIGYANASYHTPATRKQRDLLFRRMKEAGYGWDAENKELKKIGQEEDAELTDFESALFSAFSDAWQEYLSGKEVNVEKWAKEHSAELLEVAREQNTWSEEDKKTIDEVVEKLEKYAEYVQGGNSKRYILDLASRVEFLRPQPKQEWSEKDEKVRREIVSFLRTGAPYFTSSTIKRQGWANWLEKQSGQKHTWSEIDAFIEKACNWMKENITNNPECNKIISKNGAITMGLLIEDFKNYMKGE